MFYYQVVSEVLCHNASFINSYWDNVGLVPCPYIVQISRGMCSSP